MSRSVLAAIIAVGLGSAALVNAQDVAVRTNELIAQLDKTKYKKKDKGDVHIELYVSITNTPAAKSPAELSGTYISESQADYRLEIEVAPGGIVTGKGYDLTGFYNERAEYTLQGARLQGSLLTGRKLFSNGMSEPFEAVFVMRTVRTGRNEAEATTTDTAFGLAFIQKVQNWTTRVFLEKTK